MIRTLFFHQLSGNFFAFIIGMLFICTSTYANGEYGFWPGAAPMIIGVTISITWAIRIHAYREAIRIRRKETIDHTERFILRGVIAFCIAMLLHGVAEGGFSREALPRALSCTLYIGALFWLLFDFILNTDRNLYLFYVSKWYKTSWLDRMFNRDPRWWLVSKMVLYVVALWLYVESF